MKPFFLAVFLAAFSSIFAAEPARDTKAPDVDIAVGETELEVTNLTTKPWPEMEIYLNEVPDGFKLRVPAPAIGAKVRLQLARFVDKKGNRYNPQTHGIVKLWIGGSGRDFQLFNVR